MKIIEFNSDIDHLHILFKAESKSEIKKFLNAYKSASSRLIKKEFPEIKSKLWQDAFWSRSFFLATTGGVSLDILKEYVENQGKNNK
ncbi:Mobile element protein [hydrothermal vent metagenome]|uniref:Mobile element protein n=1 Tax=hydrothermal vent metagenome TaxID=652676 RepID=A0A1W1BLH7_9ZZZZ